eukprot:TRINITY_DN74184_c0_g1_i1.p1 TRINITY_DN74184_c0_g1~~TRINITY_DN74184_c0_g1_i1.p1  ORF type:complete len:227 (+),score=39.57 TRINITY_DN74184_c0_g1_i1:83-763(+)
MSNRPSEKLFVSDLPPNLEADYIKELFSAYGSVSECKAVPPCCAIVRFATLDEATWVKDNLNGNIPQGLSQPVSVDYSKSWGNNSWGKSKGDGKDSGDWNQGPYDKGGGKGNGKGCTIKILKDGLIAAGALPGGKWSNEENALFIGGLPEDTTDLDLYQIFSTFGSIPAKGVRAMCKEGVCNGVGFVNFSEASSVDTAIMTLNGTQMPDGSRLTVKKKGPSKPKGS